MTASEFNSSEMATVKKEFTKLERAANTDHKKQGEEALKLQQDAMKKAKSNNKSQKEFDEKVIADIHKKILDKVADIKKNNNTIMQLKKSTSLVKSEDNDKLREAMENNTKCIEEINKIITEAKNQGGAFEAQIKAYMEPNKEFVENISAATKDAEAKLKDALDTFMGVHSNFEGACSDALSKANGELENEKDKNKAVSEIESYKKKAKDLQTAVEKAKAENEKKLTTEEEAAKKLYDVKDVTKKMTTSFDEKINGKDHDEAFKALVTKGAFLLYDKLPHVLWQTREGVVKKSVANVVDLQTNAAKLLEDSKAALSADYKPATTATEAAPAADATVEKEGAWYSSNWFIYGGIVVAVLVVLGAAVFFFMGKSSA